VSTDSPDTEFETISNVDAIVAELVNGDIIELLNDSWSTQSGVSASDFQQVDYE
jgi:hypothetical protein